MNTRCTHGRTYGTCLMCYHDLVSEQQSEIETLRAENSRLLDAINAACELPIHEAQPLLRTVVETSSPAEDLARRFHGTYERLASLFGYETRKETREFDPCSTNGRLMIAVCAELLKRFYQEDETPVAQPESWPQHVKRRAYQIDPECWVSYSGKPKSFKQLMEGRRTASLQKARAETR